MAIKFTKDGSECPAPADVDTDKRSGDGASTLTLAPSDLAIGKIGGSVKPAGVHGPKKSSPTLKAKAKRAPYLGGKTLAAERPWEALKISRRTWYRRQKEKRAKR